MNVSSTDRPTFEFLAMILPKGWYIIDVFGAYRGYVCFAAGDSKLDATRVWRDYVGRNYENKTYHIQTDTVDGAVSYNDKNAGVFGVTSIFEIK